MIHDTGCRMQDAGRILSALFLIFIISAGFARAQTFPKRIVSLSPNTTEIIYGVGAWDRVVGVTLYTDFPPEAEKLPKVGGWVDPSIEAVFALKPDLIVMTRDQDTIFGDKFRRIRLKTLSVDGNDSVQDILASIIEIGRAVGRETDARALADSVRGEIERVRAAALSKKPKRVLLVVGRNPGTLEDIYVIGSASYLNELITLAGGRNVVETKTLAVKISREAILSLNPEVIVEVNHERLDKRKRVIALWRTLAELDAVKNGRIHVVESTSLLHPSQRIAEGAKILAEILHPASPDNSDGKIQATGK